VTDVGDEKNNAVQQKKKPTLDEQIARHEETLKQLKNRKKAIDSREKEKERKARTHRLIQIGALSEKYLQCEGVTPDAFEALMQKFVTMPSIEQFLTGKKARRMIEN